MPPFNPPPPCPSSFLALPIELRRLIYTFILPHTTTFDNNGDSLWRMQGTAPRSDRETGNDIVWRRGSTSLLAVSRQIHEEAADMLYGENIFVVDVTFEAIKFRYRWRTANNLTPNRAYAFLEHFSQRNLRRIQNYMINVESVDGYTGMIKYNVGGRGLPAGIRGKVQELADQLSVAPRLHRVRIHLIDGAISRVQFPSERMHRVQDEGRLAQTQGVLNPFRAVGGMRKVRVSGVSDGYAEGLEKKMSSGHKV